LSSPSQLQDRWSADSYLGGYLPLGIHQHRRWRAARPEGPTYTELLIEDHRGGKAHLPEFEAGLTGLSENSELVVAKKSTHYIQFDRPELVVDAIHEVVDAARDGGRV
jgi:hypothetical protein